MCDGFGKWLSSRIREDSALRIAPINGKNFEELSFGSHFPDRDAIILLDGAVTKTGADAVLALGKELRFPWRALLQLLHLSPAWLREAGYSWVARNRKRFWGSQDACSLELRRDSRFVD